MDAESIFPVALNGPSHHFLPKDGATRLVIFFGAKDLTFEKYNFFQVGRELSENVLFVNNGANDWYQYGIPGLGDDLPSTIDTIKQLADAAHAEEILTIGTSMGAYGAIQYGAELGARVLAFASDAVLNGPHTQSARHFRGHEAPSCPNLVERLAQQPTDVTLFCGERDAVDIHSAWQLAKADCVTATSLVGCGHIVPSHLTRRSRMGPLLRRFVAGQPLFDQPDAGHALTSDGYPEAVLAAHSAAADEDWDRAETAARAALDIYPHGEAASLILGRALLKLGRESDAIAPLALVCATQADDVNAKSLLAQALRASGATASAKQLHTQILAQEPDAHRSHYAIALCKAQEGDPAGALKSVKLALKIAPKIEAYRKRAQILTKAIADKA